MWLRCWIAVVVALVSLACAPSPAAPPSGAPTAGAAPTAPAPWPPALQAAIDGARQEGTLDLVWGGAVLGGNDGVRQLQDRINQKYGLNLTFNFTLGPAGPVTGARILQEVAADRPSHTDVHAVSVYPEIKEGFQSIDWREYVPGLPEAVMYFDNRGVAWGTLLPGITYNTQLVPPDKAPRSLADLLTPAWKGQYAVPPYVVGRGVYALPEYQGAERWFPFWRQMVAGASGIMRCGESEHILSGEFPLFAVDCGDYEARSRQRLGQPLSHVIPAEGTVIRYWLMGVPLTARHPNAAKVFVSYLLSREGQEFVWETDATDSYRLPGSHIAEIVKSYEARGVVFHEEYALLEKHPELADIERQMLTILEQTR
ncbi:MAG TPA: ABC transporter substrate-binding protein [Chloroflexota bacterium]|nr:ABC transporter substrate-binding protein [Chloroflexota bacterium]